MRQAYANIKKLLAKYGAGAENIVDEMWFVTDIEAASAAAAVKVRSEIFFGVPVAPSPLRLTRNHKIEPMVPGLSSKATKVRISGALSAEAISRRPDKSRQPEVAEINAENQSCLRDIFRDFA